MSAPRLAISERAFPAMNRRSRRSPARAPGQPPDSPDGGAPAAARRPAPLASCCARVTGRDPVDREAVLAVGLARDVRDELDRELHVVSELVADLLAQEGGHLLPGRLLGDHLDH